ncbi:hypothetical protein QQF64_023260 [Cirrhinus molitorella]|uniref:Uncharacterized protein n=1 Tax=Cirrhinus molitorella TaxID=172907 RepID=A0ABR3L854_9TELE
MRKPDIRTCLQGHGKSREMSFLWRTLVFNAECANRAEQALWKCLITPRTHRRSLSFSASPKTASRTDNREEYEPRPFHSHAAINKEAAPLEGRRKVSAQHIAREYAISSIANQTVGDVKEDTEGHGIIFQLRNTRNERRYAREPTGTGQQRRLKRGVLQEEPMRDAGTSDSVTRTSSLTHLRRTCNRITNGLQCLTGSTGYPLKFINTCLAFQDKLSEWLFGDFTTLETHPSELGYTTQSGRFTVPGKRLQEIVGHMRAGRPKLPFSQRPYWATFSYT